MALKKKSVASSSAGPSGQQQEVLPMYANEAATAASMAIGAKTTAKERTMALVPLQLEYIQLMGWTEFVKAVKFPTSRSIVREFYSNLAGMRSDIVFMRGREVDISPVAINRFYSLPDIPGDGFSVITQQSPLPSKVSIELTSADIDLLPDRCRIPSGQITVKAKN